MKRSSVFLPIKKRSHIQSVFSSKILVRVAHSMVKLVLLPKVENSDIFVLLAISKSMGNAVKRNRYKRLLREALFLSGKDHLLKDRIYNSKYSLLLAIFPRPDFINLDHKQRLADISLLYDRIEKKISLKLSQS